MMGEKETTHGEGLQPFIGDFTSQVLVDTVGRQVFGFDEIVKGWEMVQNEVVALIQ